MPATIVQSLAGGSGTAANTSYTVTFTSAATAGNTLLLTVSSDATVNTPTGWTLDASAVFNNGHYLYRKQAAGGETSVVVTPTAAASTTWVFLEVSGLTSTPRDTAAGNGQGSPTVTSWTTPSITPVASADRFLVASWGASNSTPAQVTFSAYTSSFTAVGQATSTKTTGTNVAVALATREVTATSGAYSSTATYSASSAPTGITAAYAVAAGGTPVTIADTPGMAGAGPAPVTKVTVAVVVAVGQIGVARLSAPQVTVDTGSPNTPVAITDTAGHVAGSAPLATVTIGVVVADTAGMAGGGPAPVATVTVGVTGDVAITDTAGHVAGSAPLAVVTIKVKVFTPPTRGRYVPPVLPTTPTWQRHPMDHMTPYIPMPVNVFVLTDGTLTETQPPLWDQVASVYYGGHTYQVTQEQAAALTAAGYTVDTVITT